MRRKAYSKRPESEAKQHPEYNQAFKQSYHRILADRFQASSL